MRMEKGPGGRFQNLLVLNKKLQEKRRTMHVRKCRWTQMMAALRVVDGDRGSRGGVGWWARRKSWREEETTIGRNLQRKMQSSWRARGRKGFCF